MPCLTVRGTAIGSSPCGAAQSGAATASARAPRRNRTFISITPHQRRRAPSVRIQLLNATPMALYACPAAEAYVLLAFTFPMGVGRHLPDTRRGAGNG